MNAAKRVVIVCRVSTDEQEDNYSLGVQEEQCRTSAAEHGWEVVAVYRDVMSGTIMDRPGLNAAIDMIRAGHADILMTSVLDRLTRSQVHCNVIMHTVESAGGEVLFALEEFEDTAMGQFLVSVKSFMAAVEREKIQARVTASLNAKKAKGEPLGSIPLGYTKRSKTEVEVDPITAPLVRHIFELYASGMTLRGLAARLKEEGYRTPRDKANWSTSGINNIIENPRYRGAWPGNTWTVVRKKGQKPKYVLRPESEWLWHEGPAIITPELWWQANRMRMNARANSPRRSGDPEAFLLRGGHVHCGLCGHKMHGVTQSNGRRNPAYVCGHRSVVATNCKGVTIPAYVMDGVVWSIVQDVLSEPNVLDKWFEEQMTNVNLGQEVTTARATLKSIEADLAKAADRYATAPDAILASLEERIDSLSRRLATAQNNLAEAEAAYQNQEETNLARKRLAEVAAHSADELNRMTYEERRQLIGDLGIQVKVYPASHEIRWTVQVDTEVALSGPTALQPSWYSLFDKAEGPFQPSNVQKTCALLSATPRQ